MDAETLYRDPLAWARARKVVLPAEYYGAQSALARAKAFSIAGITRLDALDAVKQSLDGALATGETFAQWRARLLADPTAMQAAMLPAHRLDNIFRTNLQSAYMAGIARAQETPLAKKLRPFFQYDAINDSRTRPSHAAMDNYIAPADDPIWQTWTAPCGYRCRCTRIALSEAQARARGWTGQKKPLPDGAKVDEGWGVHPEKQLETLQKLQETKSAKAAPLVRAQYDKWVNAPQQHFSDYDFQGPPGVPDTSTPARTAAVLVENTIRLNAVETGVGFNGFGKEVWRKTGLPDRIEITDADKALLRGAIFTHNHPNNGTFSGGDINMAIQVSFAELRAVGPSFRYIFTPPPDGWFSIAMFVLSLSKASEEAKAIVASMLMRGELPTRFADAEFNHQRLLILARKTGSKYIRERS